MRKTLFRWANLDFLTLKRIKLLRNYFGCLKTAWEKATEKDFIQAGLSQRAIEVFFKRKKNFNEQKAIEIFQCQNIKLLFAEDKNYPQKLLQIPAYPLFLFYKGDFLPCDNFSFAFVGSRNITLDGKRVIENFIPALKKAGFTLVSGLARGVDAYSQKEMLKNKGRTIGILGSGIDKIWPKENFSLAKEIINGQGVIFSEFPLGTDPLPFNFPRRNRIISGLSLGILVVEGKEKSGSLITAKIALQQNREVFAIPGSPFKSQAKGANLLIKKSEAKLTQSIDDILEEFSFIQCQKEIQKKQYQPQNNKEKNILDILQAEPKFLDYIVEKTSLTSAEVLSTLTILEMKEVVRNLGMGQWVLND